MCFRVCLFIALKVRETMLSPEYKQKQLTHSDQGIGTRSFSLNREVVTTDQDITSTERVAKCSHKQGGHVAAPTLAG